MAPFGRHGATTYGNCASPQYYTDMLDPTLFAAVPLEKPNIQWHLVMAWKKNLPVSPAVQAWLSIVRQHFQHIKP